MGRLRKGSGRRSLGGRVSKDYPDEEIHRVHWLGDRGLGSQVSLEP